jgi:DNA invertase Pin-like site-specific DNA recombinase
MRAVIYARYSTEHQRAASIEDQVRICRERIEREGWEFTQVFQDRAISGASTLRPGYQALLTGARDGAFDIVVAEALDRLSRDQEDVAALYKRLRFSGIQIVTLSEGEITELHVGLKGTMNALFLKDLAAKSHRGMRGRVEAGKSGGGITYGYDMVRGFNADGSPITGERTINPAEAAVVRRIFEQYGAGVPPKRIALSLNAAGIAAPRGGAWTGSTINGNRARGTGILNNEMYVGRLVWNRLTYMKDPETGRRRSRARTNRELVTTDVSDLRIVSQELWDAAKARQARLDAAAAATFPEKTAAQAPSPQFWKQQRPRFLFSGLMRCGACGSGFTKISLNHFGCAGARLKGPTTCTVLRTIRKDALEETVMGALRQRMMAPEIYHAFAQEFTAEWNRIQAEASGDQADKQAELDRVRNQLERLVDAIANGTPIGALQSRLASLEARRIALEAELANATEPAPLLHPNLADIYRDRIGQLAATLEASDGEDAREHVRSLVESVTLFEAEDGFRIEVRGELANILSLAAGSPRKAEVMCEQIKMVAGACSHLYRTRFTSLSPSLR